jgi:hypothetical protein
MAERASREGEVFRAVRRLAGGLAVLAGLSGCDSTYAVPNVTTYKVEGQVLLPNGQPVTNAKVTFVPKALDGKSLPASGEVGSDGKFVLTTKETGDGAAAGDYYVRVAPTTLVTNTGKTKAKAPFPLKYSDVDSSGIEITVKPEANVLPPIRLKK